MKLIRDKYVNIIESDRLDISPKTEEEKLNLILDKFKEEALEFLDSNQKDPKELADLMQVVIDWGNMNGISFDIVNRLRKDKEIEFGGFTKFVVLKDEPKSEPVSKPVDKKSRKRQNKK